MRRLPGPVLIFLLADAWTVHYRNPEGSTRRYQRPGRPLVRTALLVTTDEARANGWLSP